MDGVILEITPSVEFTGFKRKELIGTQINKLYPKDMYQDLLYEKLATEKQVSDYDIVMLTKDEQRINCSVTARVVYDDTGKALMIEGVVRDISERVKTMKVLEESEKELIKSNETKEKILSIIGHDLLGPIGTTKGMTDIVVNENANLSKEEIVDLISSLKPSLDSTYNMVENLLAWAGLQQKRISYKPELGYIKPIVDEIFSLFKVNANTKDLQLGFSGEELLSAYFDRSQITIVMRNMVSNAIKFTNRNGKVTVKLSTYQKKALVQVHDNGIGILKDDQNKLFVENGEVHSKHGTENEKGTGLGLIIANEFLHQHGSEIKVKSKIGEWSVFSFTLPLNETN